MKITGRDINSYKRFVKRWHKKAIEITVDDVRTIVGYRDTIEKILVPLEDFFKSNPKAVFPSFAVHPVDETVDRFLELDIVGFYLDVAMRVGEMACLQCKGMLGSSLADAIDVYLADLLDVLQTRKDRDSLPQSPSLGVDVIRDVLISQGAVVPLLAESVQFLVTYNGGAIFHKPSNDVRLAMEDKGEQKMFLQACRHRVYEVCSVDDFLSEWARGFSEFVLHSIMSGTSSLEKMKQTQITLSDEADNLYEIAQGFDFVDREALRETFDGDAARVLSMTSDDDDEDDDEDMSKSIVNVVQGSLTSFLHYVEIFKSLGHAMNIGIANKQEWHTVLKSFGSLARFCSHNKE